MIGKMVMTGDVERHVLWMEELTIWGNGTDLDYIRELSKEGSQFWCAEEEGLKEKPISPP